MAIKLFKSYSEKEVKKIKPIVDKINNYHKTFSLLNDEELRAKTDEFKNRLQKGETLDDILPEAYAVVKVAAKRTLNMEHYDVQLIGGILLHQGRIAEMKVGEGKTLVSTLPAYLNALTGKGLQIVTVNDYLAKRDAEEMGKVHNFLGLTVGCVLNTMSPNERKAAYDCDITYITNNELGFDYLRDNMATSKNERVQRGLEFCIIDEIDSVLIDEARTPLIISSSGTKPTTLYTQCNFLAKTLKRGKDIPELSRVDTILGEYPEEDGDFIVDEKNKQITLTSDGIKKVEKYFKIKNFADPENLEIQHCIILALRAHNLMFRDQDYIVTEDGKVMIVDEFTGRIMEGRRYSDGLHQAIEAKENVEIKRENKTLATITLQNLFNKYKKKCGMTGTALTEKKEFLQTYHMDVVYVPTNRPVIRKDLTDIIYITKEEKYEAIINEIVRLHEKGQPVLVGTVTIEVSELLSKMLSKKHIKHSVLNAKYHQMEAEIVAKAGEFGAVTIATNMAGRGTDIKPDEKALSVGGLKVLGTERHESRRIDNQLRGRSGRQGDPGESQFFISLEDDLMRLFGNKDTLEKIKALNLPKGTPIEGKMITKAIETAQKKIENNHFGARKNLLEYDNVINEQREIIYKERNEILEKDDIKHIYTKMIKDVVDNIVETSVSSDIPSSEWDYNEVNRLMSPILSLKDISFDSSKITVDEFKNLLKSEAIKKYQEKEDEFPDKNIMRNIEKHILLKTLDNKWIEHISQMEHIKQGITLQAYAQRDPVVEYKLLGYELFNEMMMDIKKDVVYIINNVQIKEKVA